MTVTGVFAAFEASFDDDGRRVLANAEAEARLLSHNYIGTEHLLLGLLRDYPGPSARLLRGLGVDLEETRAAVEFVVGRGADEVRGDVRLAPRAKQTLVVAAEEARRAGRAPANPEDLLLALQNGEGDSAPGRGI